MQKDNGSPFCVNGELAGINVFGWKNILTKRANFIIVYDEISFIKEAMEKPFKKVDEGSQKNLPR